jgi:SNF2 family DNA or RNA helicase
VAKWAPELDVTFCSYSSLPRINPDFVPGEKDDDGKNPEPRFLPSPKPEFRGPWDLRILDEAHNVTNRKAIWTKAVENTQADRTWLLTGTPISNWAQDLFILLRLLHPKGDNRYTSYWRWIGTWFKQFQIPRKGMRGQTATKIGGLLACTSECRKSKDTCEHWADFYRGNDLDRLMLRRTQDQVRGQRPAVTEQVIECPMTTAQRKTYDDLKQQYYAKIEETGKEILAFQDAILSNKLEQVCTGIEVVDLTMKKSGSGKLDMLETLLDSRRGHPVVVFCKFKNTVRAAADRATKMGFRVAIVYGDDSVATRIQRIEQFQAGEFDVLIGTLAVIREGHTLTAADTCIFVERSWNPNKNKQARDRLDRIGQERPVTSIVLITPDSVDERITAVTRSKTVQQIKVMTAGEFAKLL